MALDTELKLIKNYYGFSIWKSKYKIVVRYINRSNAWSVSAPMGITKEHERQADIKFNNLISNYQARYGHHRIDTPENIVRTSSPSKPKLKKR